MVGGSWYLGKVTHPCNAKNQPIDWSTRSLLILKGC